MSQLEASVNFYGEQTKRAGCNSISATHRMHVVADLQMVLDRILRTPVTLPLQAANQLRHSLHLSGGSKEATKLRDVVHQAITERTEFGLADLVLGQMLTPLLGKYVALLLPHCESDPE